MSPEAIEIQEGNRRLKVGRPSDVWSLGCILYQMVYGSPPFQALSIVQKMRAIPDANHKINFPEYSEPSASKASSAKAGDRKSASPDIVKWRVRPDLIANMQSCLCRAPKDRMTIPELLSQNWLAMKEGEEQSSR
jgi:serine/threonine-protein kinase TTK/MPS1